MSNRCDRKSRLSLPVGLKHRKQRGKHKCQRGKAGEFCPPGGLLSLDQAPADTLLCVMGVRNNGGSSHRLRELGLLEGRTLRLVSQGNPLICQVGDCRLGLCRRLASSVMVELLDSAPAQRAKPAVVRQAS